MIRFEPLSSRRVLLARPDFSIWYLGERVFDWKRGPDRRRILETPPLSMFWTHRLADRELDRAPAGVRTADL